MQIADVFNEGLIVWLLPRVVFPFIEAVLNFNFIILHLDILQICLHAYIAIKSECVHPFTILKFSILKFYGTQIIFKFLLRHSYLGLRKILSSVYLALLFKFHVISKLGCKIFFSSLDRYFSFRRRPHASVTTYDNWFKECNFTCIRFFAMLFRLAPFGQTFFDIFVTKKINT